jgi:hypothetical protein
VIRPALSHREHDLQKCTNETAAKVCSRSQGTPGAMSCWILLLLLLLLLLPRI